MSSGGWAITALVVITAVRVLAALETLPKRRAGKTTEWKLPETPLEVEDAHLTSSDGSWARRTATGGIGQRRSSALRPGVQR